MKKTMKTAVAAVAGTALALGSSGVAFADNDEDNGPVQGVVSAGDESFRLGGDGRGSELSIQLDENGDSLVVYCIDIHTPLAFDYIHEERDWESIGVDELGKVLWIMLNGHPNTEPAELAESAGVELGGDGWEDSDDVFAAYIATQAAIWHFTDDWEFGGNVDPVGDNRDLDHLNDAVSGIHDYLVESAEDVPEPPSDISLELEDLRESEDFEDNVTGPFQVNTNAGEISFEVEGGHLLNEDGEESSTFNDGDQFYVEANDDAESVKVEGAGELTASIGRAFEPIDKKHKNGAAKDFNAQAEPIEGQKLILAESWDKPVSDKFKLDVQEEDVPRLPVTGTSLTVAATSGAALLAAGAVAIFMLRRRNAAGNWGDA